MLAVAGRERRGARTLALFTVVCPTWNRGAALHRTVTSVLEQSEQDLELVIASDASSDDTDEIAARIAETDSRVRVVRTRRYGFQAGPTNEALALTDSAYVAYIDHDDLWHPDHLAVMRSALDGGSDLAAARARKVDETGTVLSVAHPVTMLWHHQAQVLNPLFENSCGAHRRWLVDAIGGWTESQIGLEDWDLWLRMADAGAGVATSMRTTVDVVEHPGSRGRTLPLAHAHVLAVFDDAREARAGVRRLTDARRYPQAREACVADLEDWYARLTAADELVYPTGWPGPRRVDRSVVESHVDEAGSRWQSLVVEQRDDGWVVGIPIGTMTAAHAERFRIVFEEQMPRQREFLADVLGGRRPTSAVLSGTRVRA